MLSPTHVPLPVSPSTTASRRSSSSTPYHPSPLSSPYTSFRPKLDRNPTSATVRQEPPDPFKEGSTISVNQPVGSISISPSSRDVCLASRKGLYILDLANLNNAPRFIPQGGTWQIADVQWSPHPVTAHLILSTSSQKLLVWDLAAQKALNRSIDAHARAITDINWHALNPNLMATVAMDTGIRGWDLRCSDRPVMRLCAWGEAGTQVKWNRRHENIVATAHGRIVNIWDNRKGSVPITVIRAHDAKIYGIDWDRKDRDKLVTCSLDKTVKFWTVPDLNPSSSASRADFYSSIAAPDEPTSVITTSYPVWRARNLPFGSGVLSLPQRGEKALELFSPDDNVPIERFEGHENVVKDFVWRVRGGEDPSFDDREFQLITWGKDRKLRIWPVGKETMAKVGFKHGTPIEVLVSRRGASDGTFTKDPADDKDGLRLPPPLVNPSNLTRQKPTPKVEAGMTRGGAKTRGMDQLEWLTKVVKTVSSPETSVSASRAASRNPSNGRGHSVEGKTDWMSLKDEVVMVNKMFPRPRINFEKIDLAHRKLTMSMQGPWANGDRMAFMRIHWTFPPNYPYGPEIPSFELERNPTVSRASRQLIVSTIQGMRAQNRQCLVSTSGFLLGTHERMGRRRVNEESDSESEKEGEEARLTNIPMLIRTCGATFGPNGQLVCFFPKQVVLPRARNISRSPSINRDNNASPMVKAITALARLQNPNKRSAVRVKPRMYRRVEQAPMAQVQAGSTMTIHDVSHLGHLSYELAKVYSTNTESNLLYALEAKRLDHAEVWSTLRGVLSEAPPAYSATPPVMGRPEDMRRERYMWEKSMARKKHIVDQIMTVLMAERDVQMLALVSCILLDHVRAYPPPPQPEAQISRSPEQDYFTLPRLSAQHVTPTRPRFGGSAPHSPNHSSFRASGWSQMLNPSSISIRGALTPKDRNSFSDLPFAKTPLGASYEDASPTGVAIPGLRKGESPRIKDKEKALEKDKNRSGASVAEREKHRLASESPASPPLRSSGTDRSYGSNSDFRIHKVSFGGSSSPLAKGLTRSGTAPTTTSTTVTAYNTPAGYGAQTPSGSLGGRKISKTCAIRLDFPRDQTPAISLLPDDMKPSCETWKLAYADFLLRMDLLDIRATLLQYSFVPPSASRPSRVASGVEMLEKLPRISSPMEETDLGDREDAAVVGDRIEEDEDVRVCVACASKLHDKCPSCHLPPKKPMCSYCRLPVKGLSMGCAVCAHRLHARCFQSYFLSPLKTPMTCPACSCSCLAHGGIATPYFIVPVSPTAKDKHETSVTKGFKRGVPRIAPPVGDNPSAASTGGGGGRTRVTYASLAKLGSIREGFGLAGSSAAAPTPTSNSQQATGHSSTSSPSLNYVSSIMGGQQPGVLGLSPEGDDGSITPQAQPSQAGREGLLARTARWGDGGLLHWKGTG